MLVFVHVYQQIPGLSPDSLLLLQISCLKIFCLFGFSIVLDLCHWDLCPSAVNCFCVFFITSCFLSFNSILGFQNSHIFSCIKKTNVIETIGVWYVFFSSLPSICKFLKLYRFKEHFKRDCFSSGFEFVDQFLSLFVSK